MAVYANECRHKAPYEHPPACKGPTFGRTCAKCGAPLCGYHAQFDGDCSKHWPLPDFKR